MSEEQGFVIPQEARTSVKKDEGFTLPTEAMTQPVNLKKKPSTQDGSTGSQAGTSEAPSTENKGLEIMGATLQPPQEPQAPTGAIGAPQPTPSTGAPVGVNSQGATVIQTKKPLSVTNAKEAAQSLVDYGNKADHLTKIQHVMGDVVSDPNVAEYMSLLDHLNDLQSKGDTQGVQEALPYLHELSQRKAQNGSTVEQNMRFLKDTHAQSQEIANDLQQHQEEMKQVGDALQKNDFESKLTFGQGAKKLAIDIAKAPLDVLSGIAPAGGDLEYATQGLRKGLEAHEPEPETDYVQGAFGAIAKVHEDFFKTIASTEKLLGGTNENSWAKKAADYYTTVGKETKQAPNTLGGKIATGLGASIPFLTKIMALPEALPAKFIALSAASAAGDKLNEIEEKTPEQSNLSKIGEIAKEALIGGVKAVPYEVFTHLPLNGFWKPGAAVGLTGVWDIAKDPEKASDAVANMIIMGAMSLGDTNNKAGVIDGEKIQKIKDKISSITSSKLNADDAGAILASVEQNIKNIHGATFTNAGEEYGTETYLKLLKAKIKSGTSIFDAVKSLTPEQREGLLKDEKLPQSLREKLSQNIVAEKVGKKIGENGQVITPEGTFYSAPDDVIGGAINTPGTVEELRAKAQQATANAEIGDDKAKWITVAETTNKIADIKEVSQNIARNWEKHIENIDADETLSPEQKQAMKDKVYSARNQADPRLSGITRLKAEIEQMKADMAKTDGLPPEVIQARNAKIQEQIDTNIKHIGELSNNVVEQPVPTYDQLNPPMEKIADLAARIAKGEKITSLEDLQLQANNPEAIEQELAKLKTEENAVQKQSPSSEVSPNGETGQNIPESGQGVRPSEQGQEVAPTGEAPQGEVKPIDQEGEPAKQETRETVYNDEENPHDILIDEHGNWKYADNQPEGATPQNKIDWDATNKAAAKVHSQNLLDALHSEFGGKYSTQETNWVDEDGDPVTMKLRIADHSENRAAGRGGDDYLSFVTDKYDNTANKFSGSRSYRNTNISEMSPSEAIAHIKEEIANYRPTDAKENGYTEKQNISEPVKPKTNEESNESSSKSSESGQEGGVNQKRPETGPENVQENEVAGEAGVKKAPAELETSQSKFQKATELKDAIDNAEDTASKRELAKERRTFMEENPSIKHIDDNISKITMQLEEQGLLKKKGNCP